jgi:hypothetical protein
MLQSTFSSASLSMSLSPDFPFDRLLPTIDSRAGALVVSVDAFVGFGLVTFGSEGLVVTFGIEGLVVTFTAGGLDFTARGLVTLVAGSLLTFAARDLPAFVLSVLVFGAGGFGNKEDETSDVDQIDPVPVFGAGGFVDDVDEVNFRLRLVVPSGLMIKSVDNTS